MQVTMLSDVYFPRVNGVSTSIQSFHRGLTRQGIEVRLLAPAYDGTVEHKGDPAWVTRLSSRRVPFDPEDHYVKPARFVAAGRFHHPKLIHVQTPFSAHYAGLELAKSHRVPVVATYHTFFEEYLHHYLPMLPPGLTRAAARRISKKQCNALDALIVPSSAMRDRLNDYGVTVPMHVLPTGIPLERFKNGDRESFRRRLDVAPERPVALFVGRIAHEKNLDFLLKVAQLCKSSRPDICWVFAGEGPALPALQERASSLGLNDQTRFVGYLDRDRELLDCYAAADVFAFASRTETQGLVLLEAMAMGLPVVALSEMGTTDIVGPQRGAVAARNDPNHFASALLELIGDPKHRAELSRQAREFACHWSEEQAAEKLATLYRKMTGEVASFDGC